MAEVRRPGGHTTGAVLIDGVIHKRASPWTPTVHALLRVRTGGGVRGRAAGARLRLVWPRDAELPAGRDHRGPASLAGVGVGRLDEIDLSAKNAAALRRKLAPFIEHARKAGRGARRRPGRTASSRGRGGGIRAWAKGQGIAVSERGRIPASIVEQYETATTER